MNKFGFVHSLFFYPQSLGRVLFKTNFPSMARVKIISAVDKDIVYELKETKNILGRSGENSIPLRDNKASRQHSIIYRKDDRYFIKDLGSRNGTLVNGKRVPKKELVTGDKITVGQTILLFQASELRTPLKKVDSTAVETTAVETTAIKAIPVETIPIEATAVAMEDVEEKILSSNQLEKINQVEQKEKENSNIKLSDSLPIEQRISDSSSKNRVLYSHKKPPTSLLSNWVSKDFPLAQNLSKYQGVNKMTLGLGIILFMLMVTFLTRWITLVVLS